MPREHIMTRGMDIYKGDIFNSMASATLPNVAWARPSPIRENLLNTRKTPKVEQRIPMKEPAISAL
jgi:hypothetical protein